jgi:hypothetical protein
MNRSFHLARPADHLYFLQPRPHSDGPRRLRLISSNSFANAPSRMVDTAASPEIQRSATWRAVVAPFPLGRRPVPPRLPEGPHDHSHAVPLCDGHHFLFTDSASGNIYLGCDAPPGAVQRMKRKFVLEPPSKLARSSPPKVYAACPEMVGGVRIAAAYGDDIVLFSVPLDAYMYSAAEQESTIRDPSVPFEELRWIERLPHPTSNAHALLDHDVPHRLEKLHMAWIHYLPGREGNTVDSLDKLWPLKIPGTHVGKLSDIRALSVQESDGIGVVVWAFGGEGNIRAWKMSGKEAPSIDRYVVDEGGVVIPEE